MNPFSLDHIFSFPAADLSAAGLLAARPSGRSHRSLALMSFRCHVDRLSASSFPLPLRCQRALPRYSVGFSQYPARFSRYSVRFGRQALRRSAGRQPAEADASFEAPPARTLALLRLTPPFVGLVRVELTTSRLSGVRSNHLSYRPRC